ncbi:hypothetical protein AAIR98_001231 [Elusimicrobium simillimum]
MVNQFYKGDITQEAPCLTKEQIDEKMKEDSVEVTEIGVLALL